MQPAANALSDQDLLKLRVEIASRIMAAKICGTFDNAALAENSLEIADNLLLTADRTGTEFLVLLDVMRSQYYRLET